MFDCLQKVLVNNLNEMQDLAEKILNVTIGCSRITLNDKQIERSIQIFKKLDR